MKYIKLNNNIFLSNDLNRYTIYLPDQYKGLEMAMIIFTLYYYNFISDKKLKFSLDQKGLKFKYNKSLKSWKFEWSFNKGNEMQDDRFMMTHFPQYSDLIIKKDPAYNKKELYILRSYMLSEEFYPLS